MINFAETSAERGYLAPTDTGLDDSTLEDFLHDLFEGLTALPGNLIRPRWQVEPPQLPEIGVNWMAFGITEQITENIASEVFRDDLEMIVARGQELNIQISCYGPNAENTISLIREGIQLEQNREILRLNNIGFIETTKVINTSLEINKRWSKRKDFTLRLRRIVQRTYPVHSIIEVPVSINTENYIINTFIK